MQSSAGAAITRTEHIDAKTAPLFKVRVQTVTGMQDAEIVRVDEASDLIMLKIAGNFDALPVVSSREARLGATVATVGFPNVGLQGFAPKISKREISSLSGIQDDVKKF